MATHALGKLKFNLSGDGLAFRWGDGEVHRIGGKKDASAQDQYEDEYSQYDDAGEEYEGYDDRGADEYADLDEMLLTAEMYAGVIRRLCYGE